MERYFSEVYTKVLDDLTELLVGLQTESLIAVWERTSVLGDLTELLCLPDCNHQPAQFADDSTEKLPDTLQRIAAKIDWLCA